jgi:hypothetical protein
VLCGLAVVVVDRGRGFKRGVSGSRALEGKSGAGFGERPILNNC